MKIFSNTYNRIIQLSSHPAAPWCLCLLSFAESAFFRIPPDVLFIPMTIARRDKAWRYATLTTLSSILGSIAGFLIGWFFFELIHPFLIKFGFEPLYQEAVKWFNMWGPWMLLIGSFSPIPYRVFTITAGATRMSFLPFLLACIAGRCCRYFLMATALVWGGERAHRFLQSYIDIIGWIMIGVLVVVIVIASLTKILETF